MSNRNKYLVRAAIIAGAIATLSGLSVAHNISTYYNANTSQSITSKKEDTSSHLIRDASNRQKYLDDLLKNKSMPYCSGVFYDADGSQLVSYIKSEIETLETDKSTIEKIVEGYKKEYQGGWYDAKTPEILELSKKDKPSKIFIGRMLFEDKRFKDLTDNDMLYIIVGHEDQHAIQHAKGLDFVDNEDLMQAIHKGEIDSDVSYLLFEVDADYHGIKRILSGEFKPSKEFFEDKKKRYLQAKRFIQSNRNFSPIQREIVDKAIKHVEDLKLDN